MCLHLGAEEDLFGNTIEDGKKSWSKEELSELRSSIKKDYKQFYKDRDFWSALQLQGWVEAQEADVEYESPLGKSFIGNPVYAFPYEPRTYYDFKDYSAVVCNNRVHFIDPEGRPTKSSVQLPFYGEQTALTQDGRFMGVMEGNSRGQAPDITYFWRVAILDLENKESLMKTGWIPTDLAMQGRFDTQSAIAHDGSAIAFCIRASDRRADYTFICRPGRQPIHVGDCRTARAIGTNGNWLLARNSRSNRWQIIRGQKRQDIRYGVGRFGYGVYQTGDLKQLRFIQRNGQEHVIPGKYTKHTHLWATDKWLLVRIGGVTIKEKDEVDLFGTVTKKGAEKTVYKTVAYRWEDLAAKKFDNAYEIEGGIVLNGQRYDSFLSWKDNIATIHDFSEDKVSSEKFIEADKNIHSMEVRDNGIRLVTSDHHNHMYNYYGKKFWSGGPGYVKMINPYALHYEVETVDKKNKRSKWKHQIVIFYENGDSHTVDVATPDNGIDYAVAIHHYHNFGRLYFNGRDWLYFSLGDGRIIRDGRTTPNDQAVSHWHMPNWASFKRGRFNRFAGRLIPKTEHTKQSFYDTFIGRDAMYARGGLYITTEDNKLQKYDKEMELTDSIDAQIHFHQFTVQDKDYNTYITYWHNGERFVKYYIDKSGRFGEIKKEMKVIPQSPEGEWQVQGRRLYLPRQGDTYWPEDKIGFLAWRIRSRKGMKNLLVVTRSLIIEIDPSTIKKLFPK